MKVLKRISDIRSSISIEREQSTFERIEPSTTHLTLNTEPDFKDFFLDGDMLLTENQLDRLIIDGGSELGWTKDDLQKFGITFHDKRSAIAPFCTTDGFCEDFKWPLPIAYSVDYTISDDSEIILDQVIQNIQSHTGLTFSKIPRGFFVSKMLLFQNKSDGDCSSLVGFSSRFCDENKFQPISLSGPQCYNHGGMAHEIMHALGVTHMHQRPDRSNYVIVNDDSSDYEELSNVNSYGLPYEFGSCLHYAYEPNILEPTREYFFYKNTMGFEQGPSFLDMELLNRFYGFYCPASKIFCNNGGYSFNCRVCNCPSGFEGNFCERRSGELIEVSSSDCEKILELDVGEDTDNESPYYSHRWFHLVAPEGKQIRIFILKATDNVGSHGRSCSYNGLELKMRNFAETGMVVCGDESSFLSDHAGHMVPFITERNTGILHIYSRWRHFHVKIIYQVINSMLDNLPLSCLQKTRLPPNDCQDYDIRCVRWAKRGQCKVNKDLMSAICQASCGHNNCKCRNSHSFCQRWANENECVKNKNWMTEYCK